ncbi:MAG: hypothetical protein AAF747_00605 [Planctomycetota bacterium]
MRNTLVAAAAITAVVGLAGCKTHDNERGVLGTDTVLPVFDEDEARRAHTESNGVRTTTLDRSAWAATPVEVPVDGTAHRPHYRFPLALADADARQRNEEPSAIEALQLGEGSDNIQIGEAFLTHVFAVGEAITIVPGLFVHPQWETRHSPSEAYERSPDPANVLPGAEGDAQEGTDA